MVTRLTSAQETAIRMLSNEFQDIPPSGGPSEATLSVLLSLELVEPDTVGAGVMERLKAYRWRLTANGEIQQLLLRHKPAP